MYEITINFLLQKHVNKEMILQTIAAPNRFASEIDDYVSSHINRWGQCHYKNEIETENWKDSNRFI